jgi:hypothetical protein
MCDICNEMIELIAKYETQETTSGNKTGNNNNNNSNNSNNNKNLKSKFIGKNELNLIINYVNTWTQRYYFLINLNDLKMFDII